MTDHINLQIKCDPSVREQVIALLSDWGVSGVEERGNEILAYGLSGKYRREAADRLNRLFRDNITSIEPFQVERRNWNAVWESGFKPVEIGDICRIIAPFHAPSNNFKYELVILPEMAFGTGHHATTAMMIEKLVEMDLKGRSVLDFGCGTGILAILSAKMGAGKVVAVDVEEEAVDSAIRNADINDTPSVRVIRGSLEKVNDGPFDLILANINRNILLEYAQAIRKCMARGGRLILSGILPVDEEAILGEFSAWTIQRDKTIKDGWLCLTFQKSDRVS